MPWTVGATLKGRLARRAAMLATAKPWVLHPGPAAISFTFDDVFASAVDEGAASLERHGARGTFFVAGGLMGGSYKGKSYYTAEHLRHLASMGHEIGCHTFDHEDMASLDAAGMKAQWNANLAFMREHAGIPGFESFAYPYGSHNWRANRAVAKRFLFGRDIRAGINRGRSDLAKLRALGIGPGAGVVESAVAAITSLRARGGWLVFMTHEVDARPTMYGCRPTDFEQIVAAAAGSGIPILTLAQAGRAFLGYQAAPDTDTFIPRPESATP